jgi:hypothetical protein
MDMIDLYAASVPQLNFEGRTRVHTNMGIMCSLMVYIAVSSYAFVKFRDLYHGNDPVVNNNMDFGAFNNELDGLRMDKTGFKFKIAFAVKMIDTDFYPDDSNYVEWEAIIYDGNLTHNHNLARRVSVHKCTDVDYAQFYESKDDMST